MVKPETKKTKTMTVQVKICGITTEADYNICRAAGASWTGMVYYPGSPRHLTLDQLARLATCDSGADNPQRVLLTVDMTGDALAPLMMTYFRSVWQGSHPPSEVGQRNNNELEMLAGVIDQLLCGNLAAVGDILKLADQKYADVGKFGGAFSMRFNWDCNLDFGARRCHPKVAVERLDEPNSTFSSGS